MATLRVIRTRDATLTDRVIALSAQMGAGRDRSNDVVIDDDSVSRRHASITRSFEGYVISDEQSANGVYINGARVQRHILRPGDQISIGQTTFQFEDPPARQEMQPGASVPAPAPVVTRPARTGGCALTCLIMSIVLFIATISGSLYALYRAGYLPLPNQESDVRSRHDESDALDEFPVVRIAVEPRLVVTGIERPVLERA